MNIFRELDSKYKYNTDKINGNYVGSGYPEAYQEHIYRFKDKIKLFIELGISNGGSLEMFADVFPDANIVGIDIEIKYKSTRKNIFIEKGDATDSIFLDFIIKKYGQPDIVLDDASHLATHMKKSFDFLFPFTNILYIIEDIGTQYKSFYNGSFLDGQSMVQHLYSFVDAFNVDKSNLPIKQICFYPNQAYIYKK